MDEFLAPLFEDLEYLQSRPRYPAGTQVGDFELQRYLGRGGFGEVYEAVNTDTGRRVALKFVADPSRVSTPAPEATAHDPAAPLLGEVCSAGLLTVSNLLTTYGLRRGTPACAGVREEHEVAFLEMELAAGRTLGDWTRDHRLPVEVMLRQVVEWLVPVAESIHTAHELGDLVHSDVKPHNIFLVNPRPGVRFEKLNPRSLVAKVGDFGLARPNHTALPHGTDGFAPPDQRNPELDVLRAEPGRRAAAIDGFALAATIYAMVHLDQAGTPRGPGPAGTGAYSLPDPTPLTVAGADRDLVAVVLKELDPDPRRRYPTVREFAADLRRWLNGEAVAARNFRGATWKGFRKQSPHIRYGVPALIAALIALGVTLGLVAVGSARNAADAADSRAETARAETTAAEARADVAEKERQIAEHKQKAAVLEAAGRRLLAHERSVTLAQFAARRGDWPAAMRFYKETIQQSKENGYPDMTLLRVQRLGAYFGLNDTRALDEELTDLEKSPDLGDLSPSVKLARGTLLMCDVRRAAEGRELVRVADELARKTRTTFFSEADRAYASALLQRRPAPMIRSLERAVELDPLHQPAQNAILFALISSGQVEAGRRKLEEVERLFPRSLAPALARGILAAVEADRAANPKPLSDAIAVYESRKGQPAPVVRRFLVQYADAITLAVKGQTLPGQLTLAEQQELLNLQANLRDTIGNADGPAGLAVPTIRLVTDWFGDVMPLFWEALRGGDDAYRRLLALIPDYPDAILQAVATTNRFNAAVPLLQKRVVEPADLDRVRRLMAHVAEHGEKAGAAPTLVERSSTKYVARNLGLIADLIVLRWTPNPDPVHLRRLRAGVHKIVAEARSRPEWTDHRDTSLRLIVVLLTVEQTPGLMADWKLDTPEGAEAWRRRGRQLYGLVRGEVDAWADERPDRGGYREVSDMLERWADAEGLRDNAPPILPAPRQR